MTTTPTLRDAAQALAQLRHLYANLTNGGVRDTASAKRIAEGLLSPAIAALERAALAAPADAPPKWPKDAADVRQFMKGNCLLLEWAVDEATPHQDDRYQLTAHDFLSAVNWWADFPNVQPAADALAEPNYSDMSRAALERHAARMAQALAHEGPFQFYRRHALGPMLQPSCICCGQLPETVAIKHAELPGIVVCAKCRDAATQIQQAVAHAADVCDSRAQMHSKNGDHAAANEAKKCAAAIRAKGQQ